jgi:hypothetical protein
MQTKSLTPPSKRNPERSLRVPPRREEPLYYNRDTAKTDHHPKLFNNTIHIVRTFVSRRLVPLWRIAKSCMMAKIINVFSFFTLITDYPFNLRTGRKLRCILKSECD